MSSGPELCHVVVGRVVRPHGVDGGLYVYSLTDTPHRYAPGRTIYVNNTPYKVVSSSSAQGNTLILRLQQVCSRDQAMGLRGALITVPRDEVPPLPEGQYYHFQLIGMDVFTPEGEHLGKVADILSTGSNDVYVVGQGKGQVLVPALEGVVVQVDVEVGKIIVDLPEGLR